jgi:hypothetical protein
MGTVVATTSAFTTLLHQIPPAAPHPAEVMTLLVEMPPGGRGTP